MHGSQSSQNPEHSSLPLRFFLSFSWHESNGLQPQSMGTVVVQLEHDAVLLPPLRPIAPVSKMTDVLNNTSISQLFPSMSILNGLVKFEAHGPFVLLVCCAQPPTEITETQVGRSSTKLLTSQELRRKRYRMAVAFKTVASIRNPERQSSPHPLL